MFDYPSFIELINRCKCSVCQKEKHRMIEKYKGINEAEAKRKLDVREKYGIPSPPRSNDVLEATIDNV